MEITWLLRPFSLSDANHCGYASFACVCRFATLLPQRWQCALGSRCCVYLSRSLRAFPLSCKVSFSRCVCMCVRDTGWFGRRRVCSLVTPPPRDRAWFSILISGTISVYPNASVSGMSPVYPSSSVSATSPVYPITSVSGTSPSCISGAPGISILWHQSCRLFGASLPEVPWCSVLLSSLKLAWNLPRSNQIPTQHAPGSLPRRLRADHWALAAPLLAPLSLSRYPGMECVAAYILYRPTAVPTTEL